MIFYNGIEIKEDMENIKKAVKSGLIKKIVNSKQASSKYEEKYENCDNVKKTFYIEEKTLSFV